MLSNSAKKLFQKLLDWHLTNGLIEINLDERRRKREVNAYTDIINYFQSKNKFSDDEMAFFIDCQVRTWLEWSYSFEEIKKLSIEIRKSALEVAYVQDKLKSEDHYLKRFVNPFSNEFYPLN